MNFNNHTPTTPRDHATAAVTLHTPSYLLGNFTVKEAFSGWLASCSACLILVSTALTHLSITWVEMPSWDSCSLPTNFPGNMPCFLGTKRRNKWAYQGLQHKAEEIRNNVNLKLFSERLHKTIVQYAMYQCYKSQDFESSENFGRKMWINNFTIFLSSRVTLLYSWTLLYSNFTNFTLFLYYIPETSV